MKSEVKIEGSRLQMTRVFNAPRQFVFDWWSSAEKLQQWSGCAEMTNCKIDMDFREGGSFTQKMTIGDKGEFTLVGEYDEIIVPEKIAYRAFMGPFVVKVTIEFQDHANGTKVILTQDGFPDEFSCNMVSKGTQESLDKLDSILSTYTATHA